MASKGSRSNTTTYKQQVQQTRQSLDTIDDSSLVSPTGLGVKQVKALKQEIAEIFPSSNLPAFLLQGLLQLEDRTVTPDKVDADLTVLFRGSKQIGTYSILAAPALVIYGYQKLLALAGKEVETAFPYGLWQFYTEFCLREDAARHCTETRRFQQATLDASEGDAATCWVATAMHMLLLYEDILENDWHEHRFFRSLEEILTTHVQSSLGRRPKARKKAEAYDQQVAEQIATLRKEYRLEGLPKRWIAQRPYHTPADEPPTNYAAYRRSVFQAFLAKALRHLPAELHTTLEQHHAQQAREALPRFQEQMTIAMSFQADQYHEQRVPLMPHKLCVALVIQGTYYLLEVCARSKTGQLLLFPRRDAPEESGVSFSLTEGRDGKLYDRSRRPVQIDRYGQVWVAHEKQGFLRPPPLSEIKGQVQAILRHARSQTTHKQDGQTATDILLVQAPRNQQPALRRLLSKETQRTVEELRRAPIIVNWDTRDVRDSPGDIRQTHRGVGDHALTLLRTTHSIVFDMSHISFDGIWGMALAEMMTGFATALYPAVNKARAVKSDAGTPLTLTHNKAFQEAVTVATDPMPVEVSVESSAIDLHAINRLRRRLQKIGLELTVNDLLILARCIHAGSYQPSAAARDVLKLIAALENGEEMQQHILAQQEEQRSINPSLLIPMDASWIEPGLRIFPATFRNPLPELPTRLQACNEHVKQLKKHTDKQTLQTFETERRELYRDLKTFGAVMQSLRDVTMQGESFSIAAMRLLAHLPKPLQHLVNMIPQKIDMLNEIIRGQEVFSNVGQVADTSSLSRFFSSRDDGETKLLIWGIMTDSNGKTLVTLRDFRPHVKTLTQAGQKDLAYKLAQDYLDCYASDTNSMIRRIQRVFAYKGPDED